MSTYPSHSITFKISEQTFTKLCVNSMLSQATGHITDIQEIPCLL